MSADRFKPYRERDPVHWHAASSAWLITRYADVVKLLADPRLTSQTLGDRISTLAGLSPEARSELSAFYAGWLSLSDGSLHRRLRRLVAPVLAASTVAPWAPILDELADEQSRSLRWDQVGDTFARPYAARAVGTVLGLTPTEFPEVLRATGMLLRLVGAGRPSVVQARDAHRALAVVGAVEEQLLERAFPAGMPAPLLAGRALPDELRGAILAQLIAGGYDPLARCLESSAAAGGAGSERVDEVLRLHPPFELLPRVVVRPVAVGDHVFPPGSRVLLAIGSANRDPRQAERHVTGSCPGEGEGRSPHLSFGAGHHRCPAATLARAAVGAGLKALERRRIDGRSASLTCQPAHRPFRHDMDAPG